MDGTLGSVGPVQAIIAVRATIPCHGMIHDASRRARRDTDSEPPASGVGCHRALAHEHEVVVRLPQVLNASMAIVGMALASLGASCTGMPAEKASPSPPVASSNPATPAVRPVTDYPSFERALEASGLEVRFKGGTAFPGKLLGVPAHQVSIDGNQTSVFEYATEKSLEKARSAIGPRGDQIPTADGGVAFINWDAPHFYATGTLLVLYFGDKQCTLDALESLLGPPFAGG